MAILVTFMTVAVLCISAAFYCAVLVQSDDQVITRILKIYLGIWIVFFICILLIQLIRFTCWLICFICYDLHNLLYN